MPLTAAISPNQSDIQQAVAAFLMDVTGLPAAAVIAAQPNRVAEPTLTDFIVMTVLRFIRLRTNISRVVDSKFAGNMAGGVLTITEILIGSGPLDNAALFGAGVPIGTRVRAQTSGTPGGTGTYTVDSSLDLGPGPQTFSAGYKVIEIASELTVQLDFHSAKYASSSAAQTVSAAFRDEYGVNFFAAMDAPLNRIVPLYADDPQMRPFVNAETNYEWRLVSEARFQVNQTISVPQEFFDAATVQVVSVDATFPPEGSLNFSVPSNSQFIPGGL